MGRGPRSQSRGLQALFDRYIGDDPAKAERFEAAKSNAEVAQAIYDLRTGAGLSQQALAGLVGTTASVICRLEDADYDGHSLSMLKRIAAAVGRRVEIRFAPVVRPAGHRPAGRGPKAAVGTKPVAAAKAAAKVKAGTAPKAAATKAAQAKGKAAHTKAGKRDRVKSD